MDCRRPTGPRTRRKRNRNAIERIGMNRVRPVHLSFSLLLLVPAGYSRPALPASHETEKIAFHSSRGGNSEIYIMNGDGSGVTRLTEDASEDHGPVISPGGDRIAFVSDRSGTARIHVMDIDGGDQHPLTGTAGEEDDPCWSPDGARIYFRKIIDGRSVICVAGVDGDHPRRLTDGTVRFKSPHVSPDGTRIICNALIGDHSELWVMDTGGGNQKRIAEGINWGMTPRWSPDGEEIVYTHYGEPPSPWSGPVEIHVLKADGTGDVAVTRAGSTCEFPCWSPDGELIAFQSSLAGNFEIYITDRTGTNLERITFDDAFDGRPSWGITAR
jgi:TolB protein